MNFSAKLLSITCGLLIICCGLFAIISYQVSSTVMRNNISASLQEMAEEAALLMRSQMDARIAALEGVANHPTIRSADSDDMDQQREILRQETERLGFMGMGIVDTTGATRYQDGGTAKLGDRSYVKQAFQGRTVFSDVIISRVTNSPVIMLAAPIYNQTGEVQSVLIARQGGEMLSELSARIGYGEHGYSYIITKSGAFVGHPNQELVLSAYNILEEALTDPDLVSMAAIFKRMVNGEHGLGSYTFEGKPRLAGFTPIPDSNWSIAVGALEADVFAGIYALRNWMILLSAVIIVIGALTALAFTRSILRPIHRIVAALDCLALQGDPEVQLLSSDLQRKDEFGRVGRALDRLLEQQRQRAQLATAIADGDLRGDVEPLSDRDALGIALRDMTMSLRHTVAAVQEASRNLDNGTDQIADASNALSQGATESAASLEEISASVSEVASQARTSAQQAQQAREQTEGAKQAARNGATKMADLRQAMDAIAAASSEIGRINQVIDGIAFQTNLLALNAAVEAARAGRHGKGFAVVADEVRALAGRSAKAAKETNGLIEQALSRVKIGEDTAAQTEGALNTVSEAIERSAELMYTISRVALEQAEAVVQVNEALGQIDQVTQANTASAEQTAAAARELAGQARDMNALVDRFTLQTATPEKPQMLRIKH